MKVVEATVFHREIPLTMVYNDLPFQQLLSKLLL